MPRFLQAMSLTDSTDYQVGYNPMFQKPSGRQYVKSKSDKFEKVVITEVLRQTIKDQD